jgi:hypothetical protein
MLRIGTGYLFQHDLLTAQAQTICLDGGFLRRLGGGKLRLSDGQRNVPARNSGFVNRGVLCDWHRRGGGALAARAIIETGSRSVVAPGYLLAIGWGIATERKPREAVCAPGGQLE